MLGWRQDARRTAAACAAATPNRLGQRLVHFWRGRKELDRLGDPLDEFLDRLTDKPQGKAIADFLNGVWLGHPLHPVLTDVPIGFWTFSAVADVVTLHRRRPGRPSTVALAAGVLAAVPTAAAGVMDWHKHLGGGPRRVGLGHALMNSAALVTYVLSLVLRLKGRGPARWLSFCGFTLAVMSAYLGGHLVFFNRAGVRREPEAAPPEGRHSVLPSNALSDGEMKRVEIEGYPIVLLRRGQEVFALGDVCPHLGCSLAEGKVEGDVLRCACHGSAFSLDDGHVIDGPAVFPATAFDASIVDGRIELAGQAEQAIQGARGDSPDSKLS